MNKQIKKILASVCCLTLLSSSVAFAAEIKSGVGEKIANNQQNGLNTKIGNLTFNSTINGYEQDVNEYCFFDVNYGGCVVGLYGTCYTTLNFTGSNITYVGYGHLTTGSRVSVAQVLLNKVRGAGLLIDGQFGYNTQTAVINYQSSKNLSPDGIVGPDTWRALLHDAGEY